MRQTPDLTAAIKRVRQEAADEAERQLIEAAEALDASPEALARVEKAVRTGMHDTGATILGEAIGLGPKGYEGSWRPCRCGGRQKYMGDRERRALGLMGAFRYKRAYYWCPRCKESRAPRDEAMGMAGGHFTPAVREAVSLTGAEVPFGRGALLLASLTAIRISKRKHREISEASGRRIGPAVPLLGLSGRDSPADDLYISADGTMAPTREAWREVKIGAVFRARPGPDGRPKRLRTHYIGDVTKADDFAWQLYRAADGMGLERAGRTVVLGDGAAWIWNMAAFHFPDAVQIVDWYHATERLWTVANACFGEGTAEARDWAARGEKSLAASRVEKVIERLGVLRNRNARKKKARETIDEAIGYYRNNAERMRYRQYVKRGLFIGSGVVEAGCKHIVGQRLKQSGMRWTLEGLRSILHLRLAVLNGQFPSANRSAA